ncbi:hypothetical protein CH372_19475, partial [Leptospira meyeri]
YSMFVSIISFIFYIVSHNELGETTFLDPESLEGTLGTGTTVAEARGVPERNVSQTERGLVPKRSVKSLLYDVSHLFIGCLGELSTFRI